MERAKKRLEDLRQRVENGEDMGALAEQFHACKPGTRGLTDFMPIDSLRGENPEVAAFLDTAQVGELSPALDFHDGGKMVGYVVARPEEFKSTPIESFDDPRGQRTWIDGHRERIKKMRIDAGLMELLGAAYVWPPEVFRATAKK